MSHRHPVGCVGSGLPEPSGASLGLGEADFPRMPCHDGTVQPCQALLPLPQGMSPTLSSTAWVWSALLGVED